MSTPRTLLVVNPAAGAGRAGRVLSRVLEELKPWGEFEIAVTRSGEDRPAQRIVREAVASGVTRIAHALEEYPQIKRHAGALAFGLATVRAGASYAPDLVEARVDSHEPERGPVAAMAIANGAWFGGGMHVAPTARIDDGRFEVVRFGDIARSDFVVSLPLVYKGTHYAHPKVTVSQGADVFAAPAGGSNARAVEIEADGEIVGALPARFTVRCAAVTLLT